MKKIFLIALLITMLIPGGFVLAQEPVNLGKTGDCRPNFTVDAAENFFYHRSFLLTGNLLQSDYDTYLCEAVSLYGSYVEPVPIHTVWALMQYQNTPSPVEHQPVDGVIKAEATSVKSLVLHDVVILDAPVFLKSIATKEFREWKWTKGSPTFLFTLEDSEGYLYIYFPQGSLFLVHLGCPIAQVQIESTIYESTGELVRHGDYNFCPAYSKSGLSRKILPELLVR